MVLSDGTSGTWTSFDANNPATAMPMYWAGDDNDITLTASTFSTAQMAALGVASNQSTDDAVLSSDHLAMTSKTFSPSAETVDVVLQHLMAKLYVEVDLGKDDEIPTNPITDLTIGGTELQCVCTPTSFALSAPATSTVDDITPFLSSFTPSDLSATPAVKAVAKYESIIVPQKVDAGKLEVSFQLGNKSYYWASAAEVEFTSNTQYRLSLRINGGKLSLQNLSVEGWDAANPMGEGTLAAEIGVLTIEAGTQVTDAIITKVLKGRTKLKVVGQLSSDVMDVLLASDDITYLDLSDATAADGYSLNSISIPYKSTLASKLQTIILPEGMTSIGQYAFRYCSDLTEVTIPSSVQSIGDYAFYGLTNLAKVEFEENSSLSSIGQMAFLGCSALTEVTIPSSVQSIGESAFYECKSLAKVEFEKPSCLTSIGESVFSDCALTEITIPSGVTSLGSCLFQGCESLTTVTCDGEISSIGDAAFANCLKLSKLYLQNCTSLPSLGAYVFSMVEQTVTVHLNQKLLDTVTAASTTWSGAAFDK